MKVLPEGLLGQNHQAKRHTVLIRDTQQESRKKTPPNLTMNFPRKTPKITKRENAGR
jgi:hypothetical protein